MAGLSLILATTLAAISPAEHKAIYTSPLPACDALGLSDEEGEVAERDLLREGTPLTPADGFDTRDCQLPDKPPAVVDCNDTRSSVWVHEMIGTCDMPIVYPHASLHPLVPRDRSRDPAAFCEGKSCTRDAIPLRGAESGGDPSSWLALEAPAPPPAWPCRRIEERRTPDPESVIPRRNERPPSV